MPSSVTVPAGASSASFAVVLNAVATTAAINATATLNGTSLSYAITDTASASVSVTLTPSTVVRVAGQQQQFSWSVTGTSNTGVKWTVSPAVGTVQSSGLYTAPATVTGEELVTITVTSVADPSKSASAVVDLVSPPVISVVKASPSSNGATISWTTNLASDSEVLYGTSASALSATASNASLVTSHSVALSGLKSNTTYYYQVVSKNKAGQSSNSGAALSFKTGTTTSLTIGRDVTVSKDQNSAATTVTSPAFSTSSTNELLLAFVSADYLGGSNTTVSSISGGGLTWQLVQRTNAQSGTAEIWRAFAPAKLSNVSVSATLSQSLVSSLTVMTFSGVNTSGTYGSGAIGAVGSGNRNPGAPSAALTTQHAGSLIVGVGDDFDNAIGRTPLAGQSLVHQSFSATGDTYWVQLLNAPVAASGAFVTIGDSAPSADRFNLSICEIVAGAGN